MFNQVIIVQADSTSAQFLADFFEERGDQVWCAATPLEMPSVLEQNRPALWVVDLQLVDDGWQEMLHQTRRQYPDTKILFTANDSDSRPEFYLENNDGPAVVLTPPFSRANIQQALDALTKNTKILPAEPSSRPGLPRVRVPVRMKITLPYIVLALLLAMAAAYVVNRVVLDSIEERFTNQLIEAGKLANDWMVQEEDRLLETLRLVAYTEGVPEAVAAGNAEQLRELTLPLAINYQEEAIEILNDQGVGVLSLRHRPGGNIEEYTFLRGETRFVNWQFVQEALTGQVNQGRDKYAGLVRLLEDDYLYVAGPILDNNGQRVGVVMVGKSLSTLARQIRQNTLAHTTLYDLQGRPMASTFLGEVDSHSLAADDVGNVLAQQDEASLIRPLTIASINYSEILGPWEVGEFLHPLDLTRTNNDQGIIGASLAETFLVNPSRITRLQIFAITTVAFLLVIVMGVFLANRITRPLLRVVDASAEVAEGNLDIQVEASGNDEVAVLAHSFNQMVSGLREGSLYRDLLGRTVSTEVREELRKGFASGEVRLEGQEALATVLVSNIHGFTTLSESEDPTRVLSWLNEYFDKMIPIIVNYGGVVSNFEGDAVMVFFGVLPRLLPPQESAYRACQSALAMLAAIEQLNRRRTERGEPAFSVGIGLNTGPVTAGALGSTDRLHYTIIGDTVNTTIRLESITQQLGQKSTAVVSQHTLFALREQRRDFNLESLGAHTIKGKTEQLLVFHLQPAQTGSQEAA
ncbi:MAG: HAMP domain-containing protein [Anaerolineae bacterium]|nr:HAMP domain-containing protein [Anaerolineae bacterium]